MQSRIIISNRKARLTACAAVALAAAATTIGSTPAPVTADAGDPRQALFEKRMDIIIHISELGEHQAAVERNPERYAGLDVGVDTRGHELPPQATSALDAAARKGAGR